jgi:peptidoglycan/LPS O-acetylase OafA/YrhL
MVEEPLERAARKGRWPALDGLRAVAVLVVVIYHLDIEVFGQKVFAGGYGGVDIFFVLSGFLITTLLIKEIDTTNGLDFRAFYARRALRLFPALAVVIVFAVLAAATFAPTDVRHPTFAGLPWVIFYVGNWDVALVSRTSLGLLAHTWSLAIEEQFYVLWPVIFLLFFARIRNRRRIGQGLLALAGIDVLYQFAMRYHGWSNARLGNGLDTHCDGLLIGCGIAFLLVSRNADAAAGRWTRVGGIGGVCVLAITIMTASPSHFYVTTAGITLASAATGAVLWSMLISPIRLFDLVLSSRPAVWVGKRSYGLYLWHYPILLALNPFASTGVRRYEADLVVVLLSLVATIASYRFVEQPFLRLKTRFEHVELNEPDRSASLGLAEEESGGSSAKRE